VNPFSRQFLLAVVVALSVLACGLYLSAINYLPALKTAFKATSTTALGHEAIANFTILLHLFGFLLTTSGAYLFIYLIPVLAQRQLFAGKPKERDSLPLATFVMFMMTIALFYLNEHLFRLSTANFLSLKNGNAISNILGGFSLIFISLIVTSAAIVSFWRIVVRRPQIAAGAAAAGILVAWSPWPGPHAPPQREESRPNVVMVGIDSLRPDHAFETAQSKNLMPSLSAFIDESILFTDASTVIGRSYPAWISIFSGQYPHVSGIRYNLQPRTFLKEITMLPQRLRDEGYTTVFATDETRFSNIDSQFGFDHVISPGQGFEDFLIIAFADLPLINILSNTPVLERLFRIVSLNRQSKAYMPSTFSRQLEARLAKILQDTEKPVLLVVDFDVAHYPYHFSAWDLTLLFKRNGAETSSGQIPDLYRRAVAAADQQFSRLMRKLEQAGILENSISLVFSDHGENLGEGQSSYRNHTGQPIPFGMVGHGISIFDDWTHDVVLALKDSRYPENAGATVDLPVEIVDIAPTLLSMLAIETPNGTFSGRNLVEAKNPDRYRLRESGVRMPALMGDEIDEIAIAKTAMANYVVTEDGRLEMRPELHKPILANKQRGLEINGVMLTYLPNPGERGDLYWVIVDRNTKEIFPFNDYPNTEHATRLLMRFCEVYSSDRYFPGTNSDCDSQAFGDGPPNSQTADEG